MSRSEADNRHHVRVGDDDAYWRWRDELLRHPDGRAKGGEPCVRCGGPIPPNAPWKSRDHHVCSSKCNISLARWFSRQRLKGALPGRPKPRPNPRSAPRPSVFLSHDDDSLPMPYEFSGYGPLDGDRVERHGSVTVYQVWREAEVGQLPEHAPHGLYAAIHAASGQTQIWTATDTGERSRTGHAEMASDGSLLRFYSPWFHGHVQYVWSHEIIWDVTADGQEYSWQAVVAVPRDAPHVHRQETPAYRKFAAARARATASTSRHTRRVRLEGATVERFDPREIYERDAWKCQLCDQPIDSSLVWPQFMSASLDHVIPLAANGEHSRANTQAAHWLCNVRKGATT